MAAGFQMSSTTRPTLTSSFCAGLTAIASAARVRRVRPIAERLAALIQELPREVRCRVVSERLEEWQRKQLEQLLLRKLKEPQGSKTSTKLAATVIKPSKMRSDRPPKRVARRKARCANLRVSHGIFRRQTRGGEKFRASISFCNLRLQARPRSCMEDAEQDLEFLVHVRQQVLEEHDDFEDCVRGVLCSPEMSSDAVASRHITLQVTSTGLCSQVLRSPVYSLSQLDAALAAWRKLREARRFGLKPTKQRRRLPPELCDSWKQLRRAHQDLWQKAGKTGQVQKVLERVEHLAEAQVQAGWERWNRVRMAAEEQLVRRQRRREWQELNRMRHEDAASRRFFRHQMREASREAEILRRIDILLSKWSF